MLIGLLDGLDVFPVGLLQDNFPVIFFRPTPPPTPTSLERHKDTTRQHRPSTGDDMHLIYPKDESELVFGEKSIYDEVRR
jgi:hypothetical protein